MIYVIWGKNAGITPIFFYKLFQNMKKPKEYVSLRLLFLFSEVVSNGSVKTVISGMRSAW